MMREMLSAPQVDRRSCPRHACAAVAWQVSVLGDAMPRTARVRNLSASGIGLLFEDAVQVDKLAVVELFNPIRQCWYLKTIRMLYTLPQADGGCLTGGSFLHPLTTEECRQVLQDALGEHCSLFQDEPAHPHPTYIVPLSAPVAEGRAQRQGN